MQFENEKQSSPTSFKARVDLVSIHGHPFLLPLPNHLLPSLVKVSLNQWHLRLGHLASPIVNQVVQSNKLPVSSSQSSSVCSPCQQSKSHRLHFSYSPSISNSPLQLLFLDVWGLASINSVNNNRFYLCG
jgi:hypothetical protein